MSRIMPVARREFTEMVATRGFLIGTVLGPLLMVGFLAAQILIMAKSGGGEHRIAILDATGLEIGRRMAQELENPPLKPSFTTQPTFTVTVADALPGTGAGARERLREQVRLEELDGYLSIPPNIVAAGTAEYEGRNASNSSAMAAVEQALEQVVQSQRLQAEGIDEQKVAEALTPIKLQAFKTGEGGVQGNPAAARMLAFLMSFAIYLAVLMYGQGILMGVQEEKRDRIVEMIVSSIRARDLLLGKVIGIGTAGVLQMVIWAVAAGVLIAYGGTILSLFGADPQLVQTMQAARALPDVPLSAGIIFVLCFAGGFFLFATIYATIGSAVTNTQEAQSLIYPVLLPFIFGLFVAMSAVENPNSGLAVIGTYLPITSPVVLPVRALSGDVGILQAALSLAILYSTGLFIIWAAAKIYRIAIFATGKKPSWADLVRWARTA